MKKIEITAFDIAQRFVGMKELPGEKDNPFVMAFLTLDQSWPSHDETPWCSGFANFVAWLLRLPRSKDLRARSWLLVGQSVRIEDAQVGFDVVVLRRGEAGDAGPDVIDAPGHVGFYAGQDDMHVLVLGGNQGNSVNVARFHHSKVLGVRRLLS